MGRTGTHYWSEAQGEGSGEGDNHVLLVLSGLFPTRWEEPSYREVYGFYLGRTSLLVQGGDSMTRCV